MAAWICMGLFFLCVLFMLLRMVPYYVAGEYIGRAVPVRYVSQAAVTMDGETRECELPVTLENLTPGEKIDVAISFQNSSNDCYFQIRTAFAPLTVDVNGTTVYEFGSKDERPSFMKDPGTMIQFVPATWKGAVNVTLHYTAPVTRHSITIPRLRVSNQSGLLRSNTVRLGAGMMVAAILMIGGILIIFMGAVVTQVVRSGIILVYLGLFTFTSGMWGFFNSDMALFFVNDSNICYALNYISFFSLLLPLEMFLEASVHFHLRKLFLALRYLLILLLPATVILQLTGTVMFTQSVRLYQIVLPISIFLSTLGLSWESVHYQNRMAVRLLPGMLILSASTVREIMQYLSDEIYNNSGHFLYGETAFCVYMCLVGAIQIRKNYHIIQREKEQEFQISMMNREILEQKKYQKTLLEHETILRRLRHDYRHHLNVLQEYMDKGDCEGLARYIEGMRDSIPKSKERRYTDNLAVNAVISYYAAAAQEKGAAVDISLSLPKTLSTDMEQSLCIVFGNLLENAGEAVGRLTDRKPGDTDAPQDASDSGQPFIRLTAMVHRGNLVIHMENSMDGKLRKWGRFYVSSKREEVGIGLSSIARIAELHGGNAEFHGENGVFVSEVYLDLEAHGSGSRNGEEADTDITNASMVKY